MDPEVQVARKLWKSRDSLVRDDSRNRFALKPNSFLAGSVSQSVEQRCAYQRIDATACRGNRRMPRRNLLADAARSPAASAFPRIVFLLCGPKKMPAYNLPGSTSGIRLPDESIRAYGSREGNSSHNRCFDACDRGSPADRCSRRRRVPESAD